VIDSTMVGEEGSSKKFMRQGIRTPLAQPSRPCLCCWSFFFAVFRRMLIRWVVRLEARSAVAPCSCRFLDSQPSAALGVRPHAARRPRGSYEQVCKGWRRRREGSGCAGDEKKTRSRLGPPCYALHRSSPRAVRPGTPLNPATMRLVLRYVGIDAHSK